MASERLEFARLLRKQPTKAEEILWRCLRGSRFHGAKFQRQVPVDRFVLDFYCHAAKLTVELDGKQHGWSADYDAERTKVLGTRGIRVIRFARSRSCPPADSRGVAARDARRFRQARASAARSW